MNRITTTPSTPPCSGPDFIEGEARAEWERVAAELGEKLTALDRGIMTTYVTAWAHLQEAETEIAKSGTVIRNSFGHAAPTPYLAVAKTAAAQMNQAAAALGLTPKSRDEITPAAAPGSTLPAPASTGKATPEEFIELVVSGIPEHEILNEITRRYPGAPAKKILRATMKAITANADVDPVVVLAFTFAAARDLHKKAAAANDGPGALKALKFMNDTASQMAKLKKDTRNVRSTN